MFTRKLNVNTSNSFFLFGARGVGKTTLLHELHPSNKCILIDLLDEEVFSQYLHQPQKLLRQIESFKKNKRYCIIIDEIQRLPKLLNIVHKSIEDSKRADLKVQFILTGSSARKLKRGSANLLAGRAFVYNLYPLSHYELLNDFCIEEALEYGMLPQVWNYTKKTDKRNYLESYARTYLKEEVWNEQLIRKIEPFAIFLEIASQMNGKIINFTKISDDIGADVKTVQSYFQILEDTLLGYIVPSYHKSIRKRQIKNPKFYLFDTGVKRSLDKTLSVKLLPQTYAFGEAFEHFVFLEMIKSNAYKNKNYTFYYLKTHDGAEVDFVIDRPGKPPILLEIKSSTNVEPRLLRHLFELKKSFPQSPAYCLSLDKTPQAYKGIKLRHWQTGLKEII